MISPGRKSRVQPYQNKKKTDELKYFIPRCDATHLNIIDSFRIISSGDVFVECELCQIVSAVGGN